MAHRSPLRRIVPAAVAASLALTGVLLAGGTAQGATKPPHRPELSFSTHPGSNLEQVTAEFQALADLGAKSIRTDFSWTEVMPSGFDDTGASYDWTHTDVIAAAAEAAGLKVTAMLGYGHPMYDAAGDRMSPPDDPKDFGRFAATVADHFQGRIARFEVWNEPNIGIRFWHPTENPAAFGALQCAAYSALKQVSTDVPVALGGLNMTGAAWMPGATFLDQVLYANRKNAKCFDAVAFHPYPYPYGSPESTISSSKQTTISYAKDLRRVLDLHGVPRSVPLWNTEIGWPTNPTSTGVTEEKQAEYTLRMLLLSWQARVPLVTIYDQFDASDADETDDRESHFGIFHHDGTPKPAAAALDTFDGLVNDRWTYTADLSRDLGMPKGHAGVHRGFALEFSGPGRRHLVALWYANEKVPSSCTPADALNNCNVSSSQKAESIKVRLKLPQGAKKATLTTLGGEQKAAKTTLTVGQAPLYVTWTGAKR